MTRGYSNSFIFDNEEPHTERVHTFQMIMEKNDISGCLIQKPENVYYYSGTGQPCNLWIPIYGEPILVIRRAHELAKSQTWLKKTQSAEKFSEMRTYLKEIGKFPGNGKIVGVESDFIP